MALPAAEVHRRSSFLRGTHLLRTPPFGNAGICVSLSGNVHICIYVYKAHTHTRTHTHTHIYIYMYVHTYTYIYIFDEAIFLNATKDPTLA